MRPNGRGRHDPFTDKNNNEDNRLDLIHQTDLEWLSLNWRKYRASQIASTLKHLILRMFEQDYKYFPTLREIRDGLIQGQ